MRLFFFFFVFNCFVLVIIDSWKSKRFMEVNQLISFKSLAALFHVLHVQLQIKVGCKFKLILIVLSHIKLVYKLLVVS